MIDCEMTILMVEDSVNQFALMKELLTMEGGSGTVLQNAVSLQAAIKCVSESTVDVVLLDLNLPDSGGFKTYERMHEVCGDIPIVIFSGVEDEELAISAVKKGAQDYLLKVRDDGRAVLRSLRFAVERRRYEVEMRKLQMEVMRERRLESLGMLVSGLAHEINTPIQFVSNNLQFMTKALKRFESIIDRNMMLADQRLSREDLNTVIHEIRDLMERSKYPYIRKEFGCALKESLDGIERVKSIIKAMGIFAHKTEDKPVFYDLNKAIRDAVTVTRNEWKSIAQLKLELDESIPSLSCFPEELCQVFLNLIVNASHAIQSRYRDDGENSSYGSIFIRTAVVDRLIQVNIADNGTGIPPEIQHRVFEPFFTTKPVGQGSGQGLSFVYNVIVGKHNGKISFTSEQGRGTVFNIEFPLAVQQSGKCENDCKQMRVSA